LHVKGYQFYMETQNSFSVMFHQRTERIDKMNTAPIFMRVTVNGERLEISTNRRFDIKRWENGQPKGSKPDAQELTKYLATLCEKVFQIQRDMIDRHELITINKLKNKYHGIDDNSKTLIQAFEYHNKQILGLVGKDYSMATYKRYETTKKHITAYLKHQYHTNDLFLSELKYEFITGFEYYLKTVRTCDHNSALKYVKNFRKIVNTALKYEWLNKDPFLKYQVKLKEVERGFLTQEELNAIEKLQFAVHRIEMVKDVFIFACYTGLAYAEVEKLTNEHIVIGIDGSKWIQIRRTKTDSKSIIPLLSPALAILEKYKNHNPDPDNKALLPVISNQKTNAYLKEVANLCDITKTLTFHLARHTFATTVTLTNGVSMESVSAMLGHKSIRTTQIYSKVVEQKVSNEMTALKKTLLKISNKNLKKDKSA
jgi:site-specific recombinase XerD